MFEPTRPTLRIVEGGGAQNEKSEAQRASELLETYSYEPGNDAGAARPRWSVMLNYQDGSRALMHWIKPCDEEEWVARQLAALLSKPPAVMSAERMDWDATIDRESGHRDAPVKGTGTGPS